ncbi:MAG TPA: SIS domain-containing protein [Thermoplasmata archaeon]|jgi:6-phospho-3-hexuloisomerase|nr:SIS domain-containing protein [Thermoplasmata archaeon]
MEPATDSSAPFARAQRYIAAEVSEALDRIEPATIRRVVELLARAPATFVYGAGRSGIIGRAFAMRLVQLGLTAYVIGESVTPIVRRGDAVVILSGRGESYSSIQTANIVRREGAELVVVTGRGISKLAHIATVLVPIDFPENGERARFAPLGTLFESASLRLTDALIAELMVVRGETEESMRRRHAIMV